MIAPLRFPLLPRDYDGIRADLADDGASLRLSLSFPALNVEAGGEGVPALVASSREQELVLSLESLRARRDFFDGAAYGVDTGGFVLPLRGRTLNNRENMIPFALARRDPQICCLALFPDTEATFADCLICPLAHTDTALPPDLAAAAVDVRGLEKLRAALMPRFIISGPDEVPAGQPGEFAVSAMLGGQPYPGLLEVYLESVNGFLPKTRARASGDRPGRFRLLTAGLDAGDEVKLKAGFRNFPAKTEKIVRMV